MLEAGAEDLRVRDDARFEALGGVAKEDEEEAESAFLAWTVRHAEELRRRLMSGPRWTLFIQLEHALAITL